MAEKNIINKRPLLLSILFFVLAIIPSVLIFVNGRFVVGLAIYLPSLICFVVFLAVNQKPINWDVSKNYYVQQCAVRIATAGMTHNEIYTQEGKMRVAVQKRLSAVTREVCDIIVNNEEYLLSELQKEQLIDSSHNINKRNRYVFINELVRLVCVYKNSTPKTESNDNFISTDAFFGLYSKHQGDFVGVYVLYNTNKAMYYVGQATRCLFRVNQHFTGHGNGDVYADYKYGNAFVIKLIKLSESGYDDLDLLEKNMIEKYRAYDLGYNKTRGNG